MSVSLNYKKRSMAWRRKINRGLLEQEYREESKKEILNTAMSLEPIALVILHHERATQIALHNCSHSSPRIIYHPSKAVLHTVVSAIVLFNRSSPTSSSTNSHNDFVFRHNLLIIMFCSYMIMFFMMSHMSDLMLVSPYVMLYILYLIMKFLIEYSIQGYERQPRFEIRGMFVEGRVPWVHGINLFLFLA